MKKQAGPQQGSGRDRGKGQGFGARVTQQKLGPQWLSLGLGREGPSGKNWSHRREKLLGAEMERPAILGFLEMQGLPRRGTFSAETRRDLDKLGPAGYPGTRRKRQQKFLGFSLPLSSLSPASTTHWLEWVGGHFAKCPAGVRSTAG